MKKLYIGARARAPRVIAVLGVFAAGAGLTAGATAMPTLLSGVRPAVEVAVRLPITPTTPALTCPGPETLLVPDGGRAVDPGGAVLLAALVAAGGPAAARLDLLGEASAAAGQAAADPPTGVSGLVTGARVDPKTSAAGITFAALAADALGPAVLKATPGGAEIAAVQSTLARSGDLRALSGTPCTVATGDAWLVGGATGGGERLRLLLANPAATPAVVDVDVRGPDGPVPAPSGDGVVVPAGGEVPFYIDALAPGLDRVAVHISARTGRVRATLHDSLMRGLTPGGADDVPPSAGPARRQVIPGISLVDAFGKTATDPAAAGSTSIRIAVPGTDEAVARVRLLDASGTVELPSTPVVSVPAQGVADVPVSGIPAGTYTAVVDSDVPVVAAARIGRGPVGGVAAASEFAWAAATSALSGAGYAVLQPGAASTMSLAALRGAGSLRVTEVEADGSLGDPEPVTVPAGATATVRLSASAVAVRVDGLAGGPVQASVVATVDDPRGTMISVLPVEISAPPPVQSTALEDPRLGLR